MDADELEFLISQHFDGTLESGESAQLMQLVEGDDSARALLDQYAKLDAALRVTRIDPAVDPDWLSSQISDHIDAANARPIRMSRWGWAPVAMAACLLVGLTLGVIFLTDDSTPVVASHVNVPMATPVVQIALAGTPTQSPSGNASAAVSIGTPTNLTQRDLTLLYVEIEPGVGHVAISAAGRRGADGFE